MVQYKVITVAQALDQLQRIIEYIKENQSEGNAQIVYDGILEAIESLQSMPYRNPVYRTIEEKKEAYRYIPKWSFNIIYRIENDPPVVYVVTIAHAAQHRKKIEKLLT